MPWQPGPTNRGPRLGGCRTEFAVEAGFFRMGLGDPDPNGLVFHCAALSTLMRPFGHPVTVPFGPLQVVERLQIRLMLYARQAKSHSMRTFAMPRSRNCRSPIALLMSPNTGSTLEARLP